MKIWEDQSVDKDKTVVVIGPNGSGKTVYGIKLSQLNNADHIGALRNIALQDNLQMMSYQQAETEVRNVLNRRKSNYWELSNEIDVLFSKLMADDAASATKFRDLYVSGQKPDVETTKIMELKILWEQLFPSRKISFHGYVPKVNSEYMSGEYAARHMSDGERVALYLAARVLDSTTEFIIIDEPEVHFHSKLAVDFWNSLEKLRPSKKFVYITHNLEFALSRDLPIFLIVKPNQKPLIVEKFSDIPKETAIDLLAAASLSIFAKRIVFCEGDKENSIDHQILSSWFNNKDTAIIPLSSCKNVVESVLSYKKTDIIQNIQVIGIVDQDYSSIEAIESIKADVFVLPFHEIESIFLLEEMLKEVLIHLGKTKDESNRIFSNIKSEIKNCFSKDIINKTISERFKKEVEFKFQFLIRSLKSSSDDSVQKQTHMDSFDNIKNNSNTLYDKCKKDVDDSFNIGFETVLKYLPGKPLTSLLLTKIGIKKDTYSSVLCKLINDNNDVIIKILTKLLPEREFTTKSSTPSVASTETK